MEFHYIVIERVQGDAIVYNSDCKAPNRTALFNYIMQRFNPERIEAINILSVSKD